MKKVIRFFSRISVRLLCFNILIVFLPLAGILLLDTYEKQLVKSLEDSMAQQGRLLSAALSERESRASFSREKLLESAHAIVSNLMNRTESRLRIVDEKGLLLADSSIADAQSATDALNNAYTADSRVAESEPASADARENLLYKIASLFMQLYRKFILPPAPGMEPQIYSKDKPLLGVEVLAALAGRYGATTRISAGGQRSMTLYVALPITGGEEARGAVLVSQSTYKILKDLYELRLAIFRIFIASFCAAIIISLFLSFTIGRPLRKLTLEAGAIVDHRGRMMRPFTPLVRHDEVGDLSRSLVRLTEQLESHIAFIESFAGDISHEFKNPLASIRSSAELALGTAIDGDRAAFIGNILMDCIRLERLISGVREISRIDAGLSHEETEPIDVAVLLGNLVSGYRQKSNTVHIALETRDCPICIRASHYRLTEVFENLVDNAMSFSPDRGTVCIIASAKAGYASIVIRDNGPGIPAGHATKIFERFFSYRPSENGDREHTGLGLAIVKAIVEGYGGSITASNGNEGGAVFTVTLPLCDTESARSLEN
jgi:two-component system sensor histidine kinase ChvG